MTSDAAYQATVPAGYHQPRPRWWCDIRWAFAGVVAATVVFLLWGLFGPESAIRVSRETTYITEPLAADGLPDYFAALLAMAGPAPPPEENAAAALLQVCWPMGIDDADLPAVCAALGIPNDPPSDPPGMPFDDADSHVTSEMFDMAQEQPWTGADLPELEAWLVKNDAAVDRIVAAAALPRYWLPSPSLLQGGEGLLIGLTQPDLFETRNLTRILTCRALWHSGEGRFAEAWHDIRAIYRLARLLTARERRPQFAIDRLVAIALGASADAVMVQTLLAEDALPADLVAEMCRELDGVRRSTFVGDSIQVERLGVIDCAVFMAQRNPGGMAARVESLGALGGRYIGLLSRTSLDWNDVLRRVNEDSDEVETACRLPTFEAQQAMLESNKDELLTNLDAWGHASSIPMLVCSRGARSAVVGWHLSSLIKAHSAWCHAEARGEARFMLTRTAAALAAWRADHAGGAAAAYPEQLDDLVPRYLAAVPVDPFSEKPFIYERRGDGYLLASVGENGVYDGGDDNNGWIVKGEWQEEEQGVLYNESDLVVRIPVPKRPFVKPSAE